MLLLIADLDDDEANDLDPNNGGDLDVGMDEPRHELAKSKSWLSPSLLFLRGKILTLIVRGVKLWPTTR